MNSTDDSVNEPVYRALVVDSGPIIRRTALTSLWRKAQKFYTVPAVLQEIRDAKAREHLDNLPFELIPREASPEGIHAVVEFARQTGDHQSLSAVDLQVLGLLYDLEREGCPDMEHVRKKPKRMVGVGKIEQLGDGKQMDEGDYDIVEDESEDKKEKEGATDEKKAPSEAPMIQETAEETKGGLANSSEATGPLKPKTWAMLVNPSQAGDSLQKLPSETQPTEAVHDSLESLTLKDANEETGGQFSDAEEDTLGEYDSGKEISDEECDVYICDPDELEDAKQNTLEQELQSDFPSLAAASTVPYEGSDNEDDQEDDDDHDLVAKRKADEERKRASLQPVSNSGKLYNSFRKYGDLMKPKPVQKKKKASVEPIEEKKAETEDQPAEDPSKNESRIIGGMTLAGQDIDVEDDGEGWITCTKDIRTMKAAGALDPKRNPHHLDASAGLQEPAGPSIPQRTACATTDFAMQNVILQMNLELLSVDGVKVRKLKSWVTRCGACYKVYTSTDCVGPHGTKRLFCERCGSDMMQRIAASVDGKTGRLRLHLSKKYKHNLRGTKFSLPKPGTGNRFQGDLLLREDQMLTGAWNQKVKMRSGGKAKKAAQSMFGRDIASNVGCHASSMNQDGIRVGFGRRNPNAAKGRERRGKKKKSSDRACGLRRY